MGDGSTANRPYPPTIGTAPAIAALIGTISSLMMIVAASLMPAVKLAPVSYFEIVSASCTDVFVFAEVATPGTILRMLIVVGVCLANVITSRRSDA
jgi:drug/metabolite transporter (DMT)-like permease